jgi:hypothetical protein
MEFEAKIKLLIKTKIIIIIFGKEEIIGEKN